jgi:hypothetical protein
VQQQRRWDADAKSPGGPEVDDQFEVSRSRSPAAAERSEAVGLSVMSASRVWIDESEDLFDCLLQHVAWLRWERPEG